MMEEQDQTESMMMMISVKDNSSGKLMMEEQDQTESMMIPVEDNSSRKLKKNKKKKKVKYGRTLIDGFRKLMMDEQDQTESMMIPVEDNSSRKLKKKKKNKEVKKFLGVVTKKNKNNNNNKKMKTAEEKKKEEEEEKECEKYLGVSRWPLGRFAALIRPPESYNYGPGCPMWIGAYETPEKAALAYDQRALSLYGPNAQLNFPNRITTTTTDHN